MTTSPHRWISHCEEMVAALGTSKMADTIFDAVSAATPICEFSAWFWPEAGSPHAIACGGNSSGCLERTRNYEDRYFSFDPVRPTIGSAHHSDWIIMTVDPRSIRHYRYLQECYVKPAFVEKLTIARWSQASWYVFNVYRDRRIGRFRPEERELIVDFSRLFLPLLAKHHELTSCAQELSMSNRERIDRLTLQLQSLNSSLSPRERSVCAYTVAGITAQTTAIQLGIKMSSVLTYRRRAYRRLSVSNGYEIAALLMR
jgi:DNA-binding CsgD family transcriptional regulator